MQSVNLAEWLVDLMAHATPDQLSQMSTAFSQSELNNKMLQEVRQARRRFEDPSYVLLVPTLLVSHD